MALHGTRQREAPRDEPAASTYTGHACASSHPGPNRIAEAGSGARGLHGLPRRSRSLLLRLCSLFPVLLRLDDLLPAVAFLGEHGPHGVVVVQEPDRLPVGGVLVSRVGVE